ncbi:SGNH hydrolase-type esterase domain-containing protein [Tanacetum coccineum]
MKKCYSNLSTKEIENHVEMSAFIRESGTPTSSCLKERSYSLSELWFTGQCTGCHRFHVTSDPFGSHHDKPDAPKVQSSLKMNHGWDDEVIFDVDQSIKKPPTEDDECYGIDDLDETITQELLRNDQLDSFLLKGLEKSINQADLESCDFIGDESGIDSDLGTPTRRIDPDNTPYLVTQETARFDEVKNEHLYSASANKIDEKKPELEDLPHHLEYAYLHGAKSFPIIIPSKLRLNTKVQDVVKIEIVKLLDSGLIYPISDSTWVSPIHVVLKKGGMTIVLNDNNELIPSRTVTGWRVILLNFISTRGSEKTTLLYFLNLSLQENVVWVMQRTCNFSKMYDLATGSTNNFLVIFSDNDKVGTLCDEFNRLSRIDKDLFTYETEIPKPSRCDKQTSKPTHNDHEEIEWKMSYEECEKIYGEVVIFINKRLVRLVDVTVEQWLDLKYGNHMTMDENVKKRVISTWLIRSYKLQFEEYLEIKKQRDTYARDVNVEYDPSNLVFAKWLASKFYNHLDMDWYTRNAIWIYWARGNDEVELSNEESSDPDDENLIDENEVVEIFRIETNLFDFETPTRRAFKEFNYLLQIDPDVLTKDTDGFKTYDEYKDDWIYELNEDVPWVHEKPWMENGV